MPIPEEFVREAIYAQERAALLGQEEALGIDRLFVELKVEHLVTLRRILAAIVAETGSPRAAYYEGCVAQTLKVLHKVCPQCGRDHDRDLLDSNHEPLAAPEPQEGEAEEGEALFPDPAEMERYSLTISEGGHIVCRFCGMPATVRARQTLGDGCPFCSGPSGSRR